MSTAAISSRKEAEEVHVKNMKKLSKINVPDSFYYDRVKLLTDEKLNSAILLHQELGYDDFVKPPPKDEADKDETDSKKRKKTTIPPGITTFGLQLLMLCAVKDFDIFLGQLITQVNAIANSGPEANIIIINDMKNPSTLDFTDHSGLKTYSESLLSSIKGLKVTKLYYYFLLGDLYSRFRSQCGYGGSHLWFDVFGILAPTARQHIAMHNFLRAFPVLLSCSFDYSHICRFKAKLIAKIKSDRDFRHLLSSTKSKAARIKFPPEITIPEYVPLADDMDPNDMFTEDEEDEKEESVTTGVVNANDSMKD